MVGELGAYFKVLIPVSIAAVASTICVIGKVDIMYDSYSYSYITLVSTKIIALSIITLKGDWTRYNSHLVGEPKLCTCDKTEGE
jgi:hypothetical protein